MPNYLLMNWYLYQQSKYQLLPQYPSLKSAPDMPASVIFCGWFCCRRQERNPNKTDISHWQWPRMNCMVMSMMLFFPRQCVSTLDRQTDRWNKKREAALRRRGGKPLHCTQESTCSALWECLDISSNSSAWEKKRKSHALCFDCSWLEQRGWPWSDIIKHTYTHIHIKTYKHTYIETG